MIAYLVHSSLIMAGIITYTLLSYNLFDAVE